jgi:hypothetical protein
MLANRTLDERVDDRACDSSRATEMIDLDLALDHPQLLQMAVERDEAGSWEERRVRIVIGLQESRGLDGGRERHQSDARGAIAPVCDLAGDFTRAAVDPDVVHPVLQRCLRVVRLTHVGHGIEQDRITFEREDADRAHLGRRAEDVADVRVAHVPVDVVAEEQQHIDALEEHLLAQPVPASVPL